MPIRRREFRRPRSPTLTSTPAYCARREDLRRIHRLSRAGRTPDPHIAAQATLRVVTLTGARARAPRHGEDYEIAELAGKIRRKFAAHESRSGYRGRRLAGNHSGDHCGGHAGVAKTVPVDVMRPRRTHTGVQLNIRRSGDGGHSGDPKIWPHKGPAGICDRTCQRPPDPQRAIHASDAEQATVERRSQRLHRGRLRPKLAPQQCAADLSVGPDSMRPPPFFGDGTRTGHPFPDDGRRLAFLDGERSRPRCVHLDAQVHSIQQRSGKLAEVSPLGHRRADAIFRIRRCTRARVGGQLIDTV